MLVVIPSAASISAHAWQPYTRLSTITMEASLSEIRCVSIPGSTKTWRIFKAKDVVTCDNDVFVRLWPNSASLLALVLDNNSNVPATKLTNLSTSYGMKSLMKGRNEHQADMLSQDVEACTLFDDARPKKKAKRTKAAVKAAREELSAFTLRIFVGGAMCDVRMLRPVHPRDNVFVHYEPTSLGLVVRYLREQGFSEDVKINRDPTLPKGIFKRKGCFQVIYSKDDGTPGYKKCEDLEAALSFQSGTTADTFHSSEPDEGAHGAGAQDAAN